MWKMIDWILADNGCACKWWFMEYYTESCVGWTLLVYIVLLALIGYLYYNMDKVKNKIIELMDSVGKMNNKGK